ncbi:MAG: UDP-N-acetylmuramate dehydrogenase, partial [Actinobacteria bacterium]
MRSGASGIARRDEPLARHTTYRIGGPAALFVQCDTVAGLALTLETLADCEIEWTVLGSGSNVLAADEGYQGAVIVLGKDFKRHAVEGERIVAGAGVILAALVQEAFKRGLTGMEFAVGVPGTLGGALVMNAGSRDDWIGTRVERVTLYAPGEGLVSLRGSEVAWRYRRTNLPARGVVVEASLALSEGDADQIRRTMEAALRRRKRTQPLGQPNAGSVFVNPPGDSAGRLIEASGLKGAGVGGAVISDVHANFIVNTGGGTAADVLGLVRLVRDTVEA